MNGRWVKKDLWEPAGGRFVVDEHAVVCRTQNWGFVRRDVELLDPPFPVRLIRPGQPMYGYRFSGITVSAHQSDFTDREWRWWYEVAGCRVGPAPNTELAV